MSYTPLEQKLRSQILLDPTLPGLLNGGVFGSMLPQGVLSGAAPLSVLTIQRISTTRQSLNSTPSGSVGNVTSLSLIRVQFTARVKAANSEYLALQIMEALVSFLNTFDATSTNEFQSPRVSARHFPNTVLNERLTFYPQTQPPLAEGIVEARIYNREDL